MHSWGPFGLTKLLWSGSYKRAYHLQQRPGHGLPTRHESQPHGWMQRCWVELSP